MNSAPDSASGPPDSASPRGERLTVSWANAADPDALGEAVGRADDGTDLPVVAVGVPVFQTPDGPVLAEGVPGTVAVGASTALTIVPPDPAAARQRGFTGETGQTFVAAAAGGGEPAVVYVGCGRRHGLRIDPLRRAAASVVRASGQGGAAVFLAPDTLLSAGSSTQGSTQGSTGTLVSTEALSPARHVQALAEGAVLASYRFVTHKTEDDSGRADRFVVAGVGVDEDTLATGVRRGTAVADAVCLARDLVNEPPSTMTPRRLAAAALERVGGKPGITIEVWDEDRIAAERLGGLLGVARGSAEPPRLVRVTYEPPGPAGSDGPGGSDGPAGSDGPGGSGGRPPHVVLVGKGITFDSGGLSLKTAEGMTTMKTDMSGAAAVLAALSACGELGVRVRVTAITPMTENMPGGRATKPGDVLTIRNGKTIEVLNTDAEGRLVLADGLSLASELRPDAIIDLATLTGACIVALGGSIAGLFGSDDELIGKVRAASEVAGEPTWPLPLPDDYRGHIDSDVADMKNIGKAGQAGAIAAALLLARFVDGCPWVHLDIAGPARSDESVGVLTKGGTGFGVRTLLELLESFPRPA